MIREFKGNSGNKLHQQNFLDCVRNRDAAGLNADVEVGNYSTGWCNLANVAFRAGSRYSPDAAADLAKELPLWGALHDEMKQHVAAHQVELSELSLSPILNYDLGSGRFTGEAADRANSFLKREYRKPYVVPEIS